MLCNWPLVAGNAFRNVAQFMRVRSQILQPPRRSISFSSATSPLVKSAASVTIPLSTASVQEGCPKITPSPSLTEAQLSRAACRAIHKCLQLHSMGDAYFIVNSLRFSSFKYQNSIFKFAGVRSTRDFESVAIQFGRPVSSRLSSHALLHGLLRAGLTKKAYKLIRLMMNDGMKVRSKSVEAAMQGLQCSSLPKFTPSRPVQAVPSHHIFKLQTKLANEETTRMALSLLLSAQKSWHRRTKSMYRALLALCILNGELILGSLLFGYMIRDCQPQVALHAATNQEVQPSDTNREVQERQQKNSKLLPVDRSHPSAAMLQSLLAGINANIELAAGGEGCQESMQAALQALAILASLLDDDQLAISGLSSLIRSLYNAPKLDFYVWINVQGRPKRRKAYEYFHGVLRRLIGKLPHHPTQAPAALPALDGSACNTLLNYALRHCLSPTLGGKVLDHMKRQTLEPDIATYNILIRSGTVMRNSYLVEQALSVLRRNPKNDILLSAIAAIPTQLPNATPQVLSMPWADYICKEDIPEMDTATLCAYIIYLSATGQPYKVTQLLALIMPDIHQRRQSLTSNARGNLREAYLRMGVALGPHAFTAILTALCKAGKIGLAERVWLVALSAERASNDPKYGHQPWTLPIHAYTIMLQCYGAQTYKCGHVIGWARPLPNKVGLQRNAAALHLGQILYEDAKMKFHRAPYPSQLDARFFNAALKIFARRRDMGCPRVPSQPTLHQLHSQRQWASTPSDHMIRQILHDILEAGYEIPVAYQHVLIDHVPAIMSRRDTTRLCTSYHRPFAYPPIPSQFSALSIPTIKQRGLPMRRRFRPRPRS